MGIVIVAFAANFDYFCIYIRYILLVVLVYSGIAFVTGDCAASSMLLDMRCRRTVTVGTGVQNWQEADWRMAHGAGFAALRVMEFKQENEI